MKIKSIAVILALVSAAHLLCAGPSWERVNYRNSTIFTGIVTLDGKILGDGDEVGAFVGNECRMIAKVFKHNDTTYVSSVIHGEKEENVTFKLWVEAEKKEYELKPGCISKPGESIYFYKLPFVRKK